MKVILLQNVPKLGQKNDVKEVNEGYARNLLIPNKLAKFATQSEVKNIQKGKDNKQKKQDLVQERAKKIVKKISGQEIRIKSKANEQGHLFAQVHLKEIADEIGKLKVDISEDWIVLKDPIKETGEFNIELNAYGEKGKIKLIVEAA